MLSNESQAEQTRAVPRVEATRDSVTGPFHATYQVEIVDVGEFSHLHRGEGEGGDGEEERRRRR